MNLTTKILMGVIGLLLIIGIVFYIQIQNLNKELQQSKNTVQVQQQNIEALNDSYKMVADTIQIYALMVKNLQKNNKDLENRYIILKTKYTLLRDSISVIDDTTTSTVKDSIITVKFAGNKKKIYYDGKTDYNLKTAMGTYSLNIKVPDITINSEIYLDSLKFIRERIYADGVLIDNATTNIDSSVYLLIKNSEITKPYQKTLWDRIGVIGETGIGILYKNGSDGNYYLSFGVYVDIGDRFNITLKKFVVPSDEYLYLSALYKLTVRDMVKSIFK